MNTNIPKSEGISSLLIDSESNTNELITPEKFKELAHNEYYFNKDTNKWEKVRTWDEQNYTWQNVTTDEVKLHDSINILGLIAKQLAPYGIFEPTLVKEFIDNPAEFNASKAKSVAEVMDVAYKDMLMQMKAIEKLL